MKGLGIRAKVALVTVGILIIALGLSAFINGWIFVTEYEEAHRGRILAVAKTLQVKLDRLLKLGIDIHDLTGFDEQCAETVRHQGDAAFAMVVDVNGKILFRDNPASQSAAVSDPCLLADIRKGTETVHLHHGANGDYYDVIVPVFSQTGLHLGALRIGTPVSVVRDKILYIATWSIVVAVSAIIFSILTMYLVLSRLVTGPITNLLEVIRKRAGTHALPADKTGSSDEMAELTENFRQMMEDLQQSTVSREYFNGIISGMTDCLMVVGPDGRVKMVNHAAERLLGGTASELTGMRAMDFFVSYELPREGFCGEGAWCENVQTLCRAGGGKEVPVLFSCSHLPEEGEAGDIVCTWADITALKKSEEEKERLRSQLMRVQKMEEIGHLAGGIAHDFNNLLTAIMGYAGLLDMRIEKGHPLRNYVSQIIKSGELATELTRGLLAYSSKQVLNPKPNDLNEIVAAVRKMLDRIIGEDIEFMTVLTEKSMFVMVDRAQIEQVLVNLVSNARDAMPAGGRLTIKTAIRRREECVVADDTPASADEYAVISVSDTGDGMDETTKSRIFEPFFSTKEVGRGTGLGLAIVFGIVNQHGGFIDVKSEPGAGTKFTMYLPRISCPDVESELTAPEVVCEKGSGTLLLAEDEESVRELMREVLEEAGYTVLTAVNGADAVNVFTENRQRIDLVLLDMIMPVMSGDSAQLKIRALEPNARILFISGYSEQMINRKGILSDSFELLSKPVLPLVLIKKVREILGK